jgi:hypothetical protein
MNDEIDIPAIWTAQEIGFLVGLQPNNWRDHLSWFRQECQGDVADPNQLKSMLLAITRSRGDEHHMCMNPLFDQLAHQHSSQTNTHFHQEKESDHLSIPSTPSSTSGHWIQTAQRFISSGEIFTNSFGSEDSGRLFRDYGLVIPFDEPCEWLFTDSLGNILHYGLSPIQQHHYSGEQPPFELLLPEDNMDLEEFYERIHQLLHHLLSHSPHKTALVTSQQKKLQAVAEPDRIRGGLGEEEAEVDSEFSFLKYSKQTAKRYLLANRYRYHCVKSLRTAATLVELMIEQREQEQEAREEAHRRGEEF